MPPSSSNQNTPHQLAQAMMAADRVAQSYSMQLLEMSEGGCRLSMEVRQDMLNGLGVCHGGVIFSLADTAFAYACNSRNRKTVALNCLINFLTAVNECDTLTATAAEVFLGGRTGVYDVTITNQNGTIVAQFRGTSYGTSSAVIE